MVVCVQHTEFAFFVSRQPQISVGDVCMFMRAWCYARLSIILYPNIHFIIFVFKKVPPWRNDIFALSTQPSLTTTTNCNCNNRIMQQQPPTTAAAAAVVSITFHLTTAATLTMENITNSIVLFWLTSPPTISRQQQQQQQQVLCVHFVRSFFHSFAWRMRADRVRILNQVELAISLNLRCSVDVVTEHFVFFLFLICVWRVNEFEFEFAQQQH